MLARGRDGAALCRACSAVSRALLQAGDAEAWARGRLYQRSDRSVMVEVLGPASGRVRARRGDQDSADSWQRAPAMEGAAVSQPLRPGATAPDFALPDASGALVRLSEFRGRAVVLVFYPLDWSPGSSRQLDLYQQQLDEFALRDARLLAVSVDSVHSHGAWGAARGISFPLLADFHPKGEVTKRYDVWRESDGFSERALYVVDRDGRIAYSHVAPYLHHIPEIRELLGALDAARAVKADGHPAAA